MQAVSPPWGKERSFSGGLREDSRVAGFITPKVVEGLITLSYFPMPATSDSRIAFRARVDLRQRLPAFRTAPDT